MRPGELHPRSAIPHIVRFHPLVLIGTGGAAGSLIRHGVLSTELDPTLAVFVLNVLGSLAIGSLTAWLQHADSPHHGANGEARNHWSSLLGLGFCGGLTTFSTHMVDAAQRLDSPASAMLSLLGTAAVATAAAGIGFEAARRTIRPAGILRTGVER